MFKLIINGKFLSQRITGVQRYASETLRCFLDRDDLEIVVIVPSNAAIPDYIRSSQNVKVVYGKRKGYLWEQWELPKLCKKEGKHIPLLSMCNISPSFFKDSFVILHDTTFKNKSKYNSKLWSARYKCIVRSFIYKVKKIFTDSVFSQSEILKFYRRKKEDVIVLYAGNEHIKQMTLTPVKLPFDDYYLSVGSVNKNKNFDFILELARSNPEKHFVIVGNINTDYTNYINEHHIHNCVFAGRVSDEELSYLYKNCIGFIYPSFYEGFGLTPLEAVASNCKTLYLSSIPVFKELYNGFNVNFFDPYDVSSFSFDKAKHLTENEIVMLKNKYSWKNVSDLIIQTMKGYYHEK